MTATRTAPSRSATTRRTGYVTLSDVAPTVLHFFDIDVPDDMTGTRITSKGGGAPTVDDLESMADADALTRFRDRAVEAITTVFRA